MTSYSRQDVLRILQITSRQLQGWERANLISPQQSYTFQDLGQLRTLRSLREESMSVFADVVRATWPDRDPSLTAAAIFGATLVAGLEWLAFQPQRPAADVRAAVLATVLPAS